MMYHADSKVVRRSFQNPQLDVMKQLLRLGWEVSRIAEWNGVAFVTTLQRGHFWAQFQFDRAWPFLVFNGQNFLKLVEKAGL